MWNPDKLDDPLNNTDLKVGIVGVETIYGQQTGTYRVMDALTTLAFDFPPEHSRAAERAAFFLLNVWGSWCVACANGTNSKKIKTNSGRNIISLPSRRGAVQSHWR